MYTPKQFNIPALVGISAKNIEEHLKLYAGYVNKTNHVLSVLKEGALDGYAAAEVRRRLQFEFNGMKNHEYYFAALENGSAELNTKSAFAQKVMTQWESFDNYVSDLKAIAKTRGVGWAITSYDKAADMLINHWVDEQHIGHLQSTSFIIGIDMWEHAFVADYHPSGKGQYIEDYFANVNWEWVASRFDEVAK